LLLRFPTAFTSHPEVVVTLLVVAFVVLVFVVVVFVEVVFVVLVLVVDVLDPETMLPPAEQGKSKEAVLAIFVQKYSELPLFPTRFVPTEVISVQISLQTKLTTSLSFVPVPVTSI
jgi:hypothetical protein